MAAFNPIELGAGEASFVIGNRYVIKIHPFTDNLMNFFQPNEIIGSDLNETDLKAKNESLIILYLSRIDKDIKKSITVPGAMPLVVATNDNGDIPKKFVDFLDGIDPKSLEYPEKLSAEFSASSKSKVSIHKLRSYLSGSKDPRDVTRIKDKKNAWIFLVSPRVTGNGFDFIHKYADNSEMIKEFLIVALLKLHRLHKKYGIIHEDAKLTNILYDSSVVNYPGLSHFHHPIYFTDFEWSVSLQTIYGYEVTNYVIQHKDDEDRIMVPRIVGNPEYRLGNWNHGFQGINLSESHHRNLTEYLPGGIIPRCFAIDSLCLVHASFRYYHIPDRDIQRIFHQWFADFRKIAMADSEARYKGKIDYALVDAKRFAEMFYPDDFDDKLVFEDMEKERKRGEWK